MVLTPQSIELHMHGNNMVVNLLIIINQFICLSIVSVFTNTITGNYYNPNFFPKEYPKDGIKYEGLKT